MGYVTLDLQEKEKHGLHMLGADTLASNAICRWPATDQALC